MDMESLLQTGMGELTAEEKKLRKKEEVSIKMRKASLAAPVGQGSAGPKPGQSLLEMLAMQQVEAQAAAAAGAGAAGKRGGRR